MFRFFSKLLSRSDRHQPAEASPSLSVPAGRHNSELDINRLIAEVARRGLVLAAATVVGLLLALVYLAATPARYTATMILGAAQKSESQSLSQSLSGLALPSFLNLGSLGQNTQFTEFRYKALGVAVSRRLDERYGVTRKLFPDQWDPAKQSWKPPSGVTHWAARFLRQLVGRPPWLAPSEQAVSEYLRSKVKFSQLEQTGLWRLSYADRNARFARELLTQIVDETDSEIRREDKVQLSAIEKALNAELERVVATDQRQALIAALLSTKRQLVLIDTAPHYAAKIVDAASTPDAPNSPGIGGTLLLGLVAGLAAGFMIVLLIIHRSIARGRPGQQSV
jgi:uncharacterized protein involved in exopolysaccharide biosynthesis